MQTGIVKWFNEGKGYGFIACEGKDYFVYYKEIQGQGFKTLQEGSKVQFQVGSSVKGPCAKDVILVD